MTARVVMLSFGILCAAKIPRLASPFMGGKSLLFRNRFRIPHDAPEKVLLVIRATVRNRCNPT